MKVFWSLIVLFFVSPLLAATNFMIECRIYDKNFRLLKDFGGAVCQYFDDGSMIMARTEDDVTSYDAAGSVRWRNHIGPHHQLNVSDDKKRLLILAEDFSPSEWGKIRYDVLIIADRLTGKELKRYSVKAAGAKFFQNYADHQFSKLDSPGERVSEMTHFNSIYEIDPVIGKEILEKVPGAKYIANDHFSGVFIYDETLSHVLWFHNFNKEIFGIHDVQVLAGGKLLMYVNIGFEREPQGMGIAFYNFGSDLVKKVWPQKTETMERPVTIRWWGYEFSVTRRTPSSGVEVSATAGGVQTLEDGYLFNVNSNQVGGYVVRTNLDGSIRWKWMFDHKNPDGKPAFFQQIRQLDLSEFLKNNKM